MVDGTTGNIVPLSAQNFPMLVTGNDKPALVEFWSFGCPFCRNLLLTIGQLAKDYAGKVLVGQIDTIQEPGLATRFGITSIPCVLLFNGSDEPLARLEGVNPYHDYVNALAKLPRARPAESHGT